MGKRGGSASDGRTTASSPSSEAQIRLRCAMSTSLGRTTPVPFAGWPAYRHMPGGIVLREAP
jgi:hypothetical protein